MRNFARTCDVDYNGNALKLSQIVRACRASGRKEKEVTLGRFWRERLTMTEILLLYLWKFQNVHLGNGFKTTMQVFIASRLEICDTCTLALALANIKELFGAPSTQVRIFASCIEECKNATIWKEARVDMYDGSPDRVPFGSLAVLEIQ
jgi:hypothetical protein